MFGLELLFGVVRVLVKYIETLVLVGWWVGWLLSGPSVYWLFDWFARLVSFELLGVLLGWLDVGFDCDLNKDKHAIANTRQTITTWKHKHIDRPRQTWTVTEHTGTNMLTQAHASTHKHTQTHTHTQHMRKMMRKSTIITFRIISTRGR